MVETVIKQLTNIRFVGVSTPATIARKYYTKRNQAKLVLLQNIPQETIFKSDPKLLSSKN